jgi:hypothetical protein
MSARQPVELREALAEAIARRHAQPPRPRVEPSGSGAEPAHRGCAPSVPVATPSGCEQDQSQSGSIQSLTLSKKLANHLGLGERPELRWSLYLRCERLADKHGEPFFTLVREVLSKAKCARNQGHYFCKAMTAKIREAGYLEAL